MKPSVRFNTPPYDEARLSFNGSHQKSKGTNGNHGRNEHNPKKPFSGKRFFLLIDDYKKQNLENLIRRQGGKISPALSEKTTHLVTTRERYSQNPDVINELARFNHIHVVSEDFIHDPTDNEHILRDGESQSYDSRRVNGKEPRRHRLHQHNSWGPGLTADGFNGRRRQQSDESYNLDWDDDRSSNESDDSEDGKPDTFVICDNDNVPETDYNDEPDNSVSAGGLSQEMQKERMEWQSFLASVLTGEVIKSEKRRLSGSARQAYNINFNMWLGIRAAVHGRLTQNPTEEKAIVEERRQQIDSVLNEVVQFEVKHGDVSALDQVAELLQKVDACESLYPSRKAMMEDKPLYKSAEFTYSLDALNSWLTVTRSLQTQLKILQNWTGSEDLIITRSKDAPADAEPSFLERILKENSLKQTFEKRTLSTLNSLLLKAKSVMNENAIAFAKMKLPPYISELQQLLNFPTKLMEECMKLLLEYANVLNDPTILMIQQMMDDFRISLSLACQIKHQYLELIKPAKGWEIPPCIGESYNTVLLESLKFYFNLLQLKIKHSYKNKTVFFKEAEILENEWSFLSGICRQIAGGDCEAAEKFCVLTNILLQSVITYFGSELENVPTDTDGSNLSKIYNRILDSVRLRSRKLMRSLFSELENSAEYFIDDTNYPAFIEGLERTDHVLVYSNTFEENGVCLIVEQSLYDQQDQIRKLLKAVLTPYEKDKDDFDNEVQGLQYVLLLSPRVPIEWNGPVMEMSMDQINIDLKTHRTRLVADGSSYSRLHECKKRFRKAVENCGIKVLLETRANVPSVNREITKIKKTIFKFVNKIIDSVNTIRERTKNIECQDLIENCFSFATELGQRSLRYLHRDAVRAQLNVKLTRMSIDWVSFICDDCVPSDRKTFRWAVIALEFTMATNRGNNILGLTESEFAMLRSKVGMCMRLFISHVDIMGARSSHEALEKEKLEVSVGQYGQPINSEDSSVLRDEWIAAVNELESRRAQKEQEQRLVGKVLDDDQPEYKPLVFLASSSSNISLRWQQGKFIGGGTFGSVYLAVNLDTGGLMAVKEIRFQDPSSLSTLYKSVKEEMSVMEMLDHPNIVSYYGIEVHRDKVYIFMEYCPGGSLSSQLELGRIEDENVIQYYAFQMLQGIIYLHENNIVHRDIKPDNILLDHQGVIKFVDFGAAKILAKNQKTMGRTTMAPRTNVNSLTGTPMYMAPEIITGSEKGRNGSMDIWSLGCCVLEMATGRRPWSNLDNEWAVMYHVVTGHPPLPDPSQLSELGMDFLKQCFVRSPQQRPTAKELLSHPWISNIQESTIENSDWNGSGLPSNSGTSTMTTNTATTDNGSTPATPFNNFSNTQLNSSLKVNGLSSVVTASAECGDITRVSYINGNNASQDLDATTPGSVLSGSWSLVGGTNE
ncbi:6742_t:CDS:2 [Acaulospora morrowiae]|uniref:6742_t:CDS:1 n=1 Tax=Acaulospora morrowiae TaxID=94023 RepID=A0A9N9B4W4_9GLOM|nr:6742_t:CDS:2 [Acaulospora morrowiae]